MSNMSSVKENESVSVKVECKNVIEIASFYGLIHQREKLEEEMVELLHELVKDKKGDGSIDNLEEEIADVIFMIYQIMYLYRIQVENIEGIIQYKAKRQFERMEIDYE